VFYLMKKPVSRSAAVGVRWKGTRESRWYATHGTSDNARAIARPTVWVNVEDARFQDSAKARSAVALPLLVLRFNALGSAWV
jgi:hypothetical protein